MKNAFSVLSFFLASSLGMFAADVSLAGAWTIESDVAGNVSTSAFQFQQEGKKLSGVQKTSEGKDAAITGEIDGNKVTWKYEADWEGNPLTISHTGTIDSAGVINGTVLVEPMGVEGTFVAKKAEKNAAPEATKKAAPDAEKK
ncbi:MAG: hypothetical protein PSV13_09735 [Lacunisphaera sp.]|nr:hypothetical protein [Lacunisphaera sp.]